MRRVPALLLAVSVMCVTLVVARHRRTIGETQIYDVLYRTDGRGRRDYTRLFDAGDLRYRLAELDYHNSATANRVIAARLVADLLDAR